MELERALALMEKGVFLENVRALARECRGLADASPKHAAAATVLVLVFRDLGLRLDGEPLDVRMAKYLEANLLTAAKRLLVGGDDAALEDLTLALRASWTRSP